MGWDLIAVFPIKQNEITKFIKDNNIDLDDIEQHDTICEYYKKTYFLDENIEIYYSDWKKKHEIFSAFRTSFLRDEDDLIDINFSVKNAESAIKAAEKLESLENLDVLDYSLHFTALAKWLRNTAKYCDVYYLSY